MNADWHASRAQRRGRQPRTQPAKPRPPLINKAFVQQIRWPLVCGHSRALWRLLCLSSETQCVVVKWKWPPANQKLHWLKPSKASTSTTSRRKFFQVTSFANTLIHQQIQASGPNFQSLKYTPRPLFLHSLDFVRTVMECPGGGGGRGKNNTRDFTFLLSSFLKSSAIHFPSQNASQFSQPWI